MLAMLAVLALGQAAHAATPPDMYPRWLYKGLLPYRAY
jgi:hypothetical protein